MLTQRGEIEFVITYQRSYLITTLKHTLHNIFWIIIADVVQQIICVMCSMRAQIHMENENISLLHISDISHGCCKFSTHSMWCLCNICIFSFYFKPVWTFELLWLDFWLTETSLLSDFSHFTQLSSALEQPTSHDSETANNTKHKEILCFFFVSLLLNFVDFQSSYNLKS